LPNQRQSLKLAAISVPSFARNSDITSFHRISVLAMKTKAGETNVAVLKSLIQYESIFSASSQQKF